MCEIQQGDCVAVIGAGPVGLCSMACAKTFNAGKIIAIDIDDYRLNLALKLGIADYVLNSQKCDIDKEIKKLTENRGADSVIEAARRKKHF